MSDHSGPDAGAPRGLVIYTDGASRGNPGPAGIGAIILDEAGRVVAEISRGIGIATNNEAEYLALAEALEKARSLGARRVRVYVDSQLVARQLCGDYAVRSERLKPLIARVQALRREFDACPVSHVGRAMNARADELANMGIDASSIAHAEEQEGPRPQGGGGPR